MNQDLNDYIQVRGELIKAINTFPKDKQTSIIFDKWSFQDIIAHLAGWDAHFIEEIVNLKNNQIEKSVWKSIAEQNILSVKEYSNNKVFSIYRKISQDLIKELNDLPENLWDKPLFLGKKSFTPKKFLLIWVQHLTDHLKQIKEKL